MQYIETDLQRLQMKLKVEPRHLHEAIEAEYAAAAKAKPVRRPIELDPKSGGAGFCYLKNLLHTKCHAAEGKYGRGWTSSESCWAVQVTLGLLAMRHRMLRLLQRPLRWLSLLTLPGG